MTKERMIELLEIEHECMRRGAHNECDRNCAKCELVQDDQELDEMYTGVITLLKEQEAVVPCLMQDAKGIWNTCGKCGHILKSAFLNPMEENNTFFYYPKFCSECGQKVKWNE